MDHVARGHRNLMVTERCDSLLLRKSTHAAGSVAMESSEERSMWVMGGIASLSTGLGQQ
jgi:hypothetical protein